MTPEFWLLHQESAIKPKNETYLNLELLGVAIQQLAEVQISGLERNLVNYRQIKEAAKELRKKQILIK